MLFAVIIHELLIFPHYTVRYMKARAISILFPHYTSSTQYLCSVNSFWRNKNVNPRVSSAITKSVYLIHGLSHIHYCHHCWSYYHTAALAPLLIFFNIISSNGNALDSEKRMVVPKESHSNSSTQTDVLWIEFHFKGNNQALVVQW